LCVREEEVIDKKALLKAIGLTTATVICIIGVFSDVLIALLNLPFYLLNAWAFWLTLLNVVLLLILLWYVRRRDETVRVVFVIQGIAENEDFKVAQVEPKLKMEEFEHV